MFSVIAYKYATFRKKNRLLGGGFELMIIALFFVSILAASMASNITVILYSFGLMLFCCFMCVFFKKADYYRNSMPD